MRYALLPLCLAALCQAQTHSPVLLYSARFGPALQIIHGSIVAPGGEAVIVGQTQSGTVPGTPEFRNPDIFVGKLSADGTSPVCGASFGGGGEELPVAVAPAPNGDVLIAGTTASSEFPVTPNAFLTKPAQPHAAFLTRTDACGVLRAATFLPNDFSPSTVAANLAGEIFVAAKDRLDDTRTHILKMDAGVTQILHRASWSGTVAAMAVDNEGNLFVAGMRDRRAVVSKFTGSLERTGFESLLGDTVLAMHTSILLAPDGSTWLAGAEIPPGFGILNLVYASGSYLPVSDNLAATLTHLDSDGAVLLHKTIDMFATGITGATRLPVGLGLGPDGRLWVALRGPSGFPIDLPVSSRTPVPGVHLRSFNTAGQPTGGDILVPYPSIANAGLISPAAPPVSFSPDGRVLVAMLTRIFPVTPGSADSQNPDAAALVAFDLNHASAPVIEVDREVLDIDSFYSSAYSTLTPPKAVKFSSPDASGLAFTAAVVPTFPTLPFGLQSAFATTDTTGQLPAAVRIDPVADGHGNAVLLLLVPGAQGLPAVPIRRRNLNALWRATLKEPIEVSAPSNTVVRSTVRVEAVVAGNAAMIAPFPFAVESATSWFRLEGGDRIGTADIPFEADLTGQAPGRHSAQLRIISQGVTQSISVPVTIGPIIRFDGLPIADVIVPAGGSASVTITLRSTGAPLDFRVLALQDWTKVSPSSGRTPQEITITATPPSPRPGDLAAARIGVEDGGIVIVTSLRFRIVPAGAGTGLPARPDGLLRSTLAPGGLVSFSAGTSRCQPTPTQPSPWPRTLGGCTLRVNGRALPIGRIDETPNLSGARILQPIHEVTAQLPYDLDPGAAAIELEDRDGRKSSLAATIAAAAPVVLASPVSPPAPPFSARPGESIGLRLHGIGLLNGDAPWGELPTASLTPQVPIAVFIGGRSARLIRAELSATEIGIVEIEAEVPMIAPDAHQVTLRIGDSSFPMPGVIPTSLLLVTPIP